MPPTSLCVTKRSNGLYSSTHLWPWGTWVQPHDATLEAIDHLVDRSAPFGIYSNKDLVDLHPLSKFGREERACGLSRRACCKIRAGEVTNINNVSDRGQR